MDGWMDTCTEYHTSFSLFLSFFSVNFALAHCALALPAVLSQGRRGHSLRRAFCVKPGAGPLVWKFPVKSCDRLAREAHKKERA